MNLSFYHYKKKSMNNVDSDLTRWENINEEIIGSLTSLAMNPWNRFNSILFATGAC